MHTDVMNNLLGKKVFEKNVNDYLKKQEQHNRSFYWLKISLGELNNNRNIIVHENAKLNLQEAQIVTYIQHTKLFLEATDHIVYEIPEFSASERD